MLFWHGGSLSRGLSVFSSWFPSNDRSWPLILSGSRFSVHINKLQQNNPTHFPCMYHNQPLESAPHRGQLLFCFSPFIGKPFPLQRRHNGRDRVSNHQPHDCLLNCIFRRRSTKTPKLRVTGLCAGNSPETGEFPAQMASNAENVPFDDVIMENFTGPIPNYLFKL